MLMLASGDYLSEHHPAVFTPVYRFGVGPLSLGFNDDGDMLVKYPPHPLLPHSEVETDFTFCDCGKSPILISSVSDEDGLRLILSVISHDCGHGYIVTRQEQKPASKKRRKRDAQKKAA